ncbi:restriction endonuclease [Nocardia sp. NBC_00881]|uniref:restriction endonuclease n=1 Tax=Nocardia sp. NBC_00881 TaxID=2975995 RepID=UPI00386C0103|nr:restriction endonuclease [Nocardia sp. NBC_00881]
MARRRRHRSDRAGLVLMAAIAGVIILAPLARFVRDNTTTVAAIVISVIIAVLLALVLRARHRRRRAEHEQDRLRAVLAFHDMNDKQFEHALAALCRAGGCREVQVCGGAGDRGADVTAVTPDGRRLIVQAKRYNIRRPVGDREMQQLAGGLLTWHQFDLAVLVATSTFTKAARETAARNGIRLVDNKTLAAWNSGTGPAPWN